MQCCEGDVVEVHAEAAYMILHDVCAWIYFIYEPFVRTVCVCVIRAAGCVLRECSLNRYDLSSFYSDLSLFVS